MKSDPDGFMVKSEASDSESIYQKHEDLTRNGGKMRHLLNLIRMDTLHIAPIFLLTIWKTKYQPI